jgi:hypothetical protein
MNMIGDFEFIRFDGQPEPPAEQLDAPIQRRGVDGTGFWKTGQRGRPFVIRASVDHVNMAAAWAAVKSYRALIGEDPVSFVNDSAVWDNDNWKVVVLDVHQVTRYAVLGGTGGLNPPSGAWLVCDFVLCAVAVEAG